MKKLIKQLLNKEEIDHLIVSFPKCGRTWLRMILNQIIINDYGIKNGDLLETYSLTKSIKTIPNVDFSHDDRPNLKKVEDILTDKSDFKNKKVIFLIRDPRDVIVSYYFQYTKRGSRERANDNFDGTMKEFLRHDTGSIDSLLHFYNIWAKNRVVPENFLIVRYEDLMDNTVYFLQRVLDFLKIPAKLETIQEAVEYCKFDNMKRMETSGEFGNRLTPGNKDDVESFKVRKGKVGNYVEYLDSEDIEYINKKINENLDKYYYYYH